MDSELDGLRNGCVLIDGNYWCPKSVIVQYVDSVDEQRCVDNFVIWSRFDFEIVAYRQCRILTIPADGFKW